MMRILLFLATNSAIMVVISIIFYVFGLSGTLYAQGVNLNLNALLVMSAIIGMPEIGIFEAAEANAFATGMNKKHCPGGCQ